MPSTRRHVLQLALVTPALSLTAANCNGRGLLLILQLIVTIIREVERTRDAGAAVDVATLDVAQSMVVLQNVAEHPQALALTLELLDEHDATQERLDVELPERWLEPGEIVELTLPRLRSSHTGWHRVRVWAGDDVFDSEPVWLAV